MSLGGKTVALSVGHHKRARGASYKGVYEYEIALEWVGLICSNSKDCEIVMVPPGTLPYKVGFINELGADAAYELHFNSCGSCGAKGSETLYYPGSTKGKRMASRVQSDIVSVLGVKDRGVKEGWYRMDRPGIVDYSGDIDGDEVIDYFLRKTKMKSAILEPMFIDEAYYKTLTIKEASEIAKVLVSAAV